MMDIGCGHVESLEARRDERDRLALYAVLEVNGIAQKLHEADIFSNYSVELMPDFPTKGDFYLAGLAMTDNPASQGLPPQTFTAEQLALAEQFNTECKIDLEEAKPPLIRRIFTPQKKRLEDMDAEKIDALTASIADVSKDVKKLSASLTLEPKEIAAEGIDAPKEATPKEETIQTLSTQFSALEKKVESMGTEMKSLATDFKGVEENSPSTRRPHWWMPRGKTILHPTAIDRLKSVFKRLTLISKSPLCLSAPPIF